MTLEQKYTRDWYYRNAITAIHEYIKANLLGRRAKDAAVYAECLLSACEADAELAAELIEQKCDRIRYVNHRTDKKGKLVGVDVVLSDGDAWKSARESYYEKRKQGKSK